MDRPNASTESVDPNSDVNQVNEETPSKPLTPFMLAKIERNRQRALMLRQARLANRPTLSEGVCTCVYVCVCRIVVI